MALHERAERAKIFTPFDALRGFREALAEKERVIVPCSELSEERKQDLDRKLQLLQKHDMVTIIYYNNGEYLQISGIVTRLELSLRILKVVNTAIPLEMIYDIQCERITRAETGSI